MAFEGFQITIPGLVAGADLSAATTQFKFVKLNGTDDQVVLCSATTDKPIGVLQAPAAGSGVGTPVTVCALGTTKIQAGGSITSGDSIGTTTGAQAATYAQGTDTTKYLVGQAIEVAGGTSAGNYITACINCLSLARGA